MDPSFETMKASKEVKQLLQSGTQILQTGKCPARSLLRLCLMAYAQ